MNNSIYCIFCIALSELLNLIVTNGICQLYEQGASKERIGKYVKHFMAWAKGGFSTKLVLDIDVYSQRYLMLFDSPLGVPSVNWKKQRKGEEKCEEYCLGYVPLG